jgi:hypothetical protein
MSEYNGWKNRQTWNVALWLGSDENLYRAACRFMEINPKLKKPYVQFILSEGLENERTGDNIAWAGSRLDYKALDDMMRELVA